MLYAHRWARVTVMCVLALGASACSRTAEPPPNVLLVTLDTLRADHLGCYGYERPTSPRLDAFAATATRYERAISASPWTLPTHASLFTGMPPFAHRAHTVVVDDRDDNNVRPLAEEHLTLAEALRAEGYRTGAFVANEGYLSAKWNLDQGFDLYHVERVYAEQLNPRIFRWLETNLETEDERPFFLFVNYIDTHLPYNTRARPGLMDPPAIQDDGQLLRSLKRRVMPAKEPVPERLRRRVIDQYDTAIANVDEQLGVLLDKLSDSGLGENTLIVITSDHGEYFGEHHLVQHSKDVYQPALAVPLILRDPGQVEGEVVDEMVVSNDLPNLILSRLPSTLRERLEPRFPDSVGSHLVIAENYYTRAWDLFHPEWGWRFQRIRRAVFEWPYKYIDSTDGQHELYDLARDPSESRNLIASRSDRARRMAAALRELEAGTASTQAGPEIPRLSEEDLERLRALGYVGD